MYGKIFESIFDSSLSADGGWLPTYIFMSMVVLADQDGIVDVAPKALYRRLGFRDYDCKISHDEFLSAIQYLEQVDTDSRSSLQQGRRIVRTCEIDEIEGNRGWVIVNYEYYRKKGSREDRATQSTLRSRRWRAKNSNKNKDETQGDAKGRKGRHTDTDTDTDTSKRNGHVTAGFDRWWSEYPRKVKKKTALEIWRRKKPDPDILIADVQNRLAKDARWKRGFVPDPTTYLTGERWNDEIETPKASKSYAEELRDEMIASGMTEGMGDVD